MTLSRTDLHKLTLAAKAIADVEIMTINRFSAEIRSLATDTYLNNLRTYTKQAEAHVSDRLDRYMRALQTNDPLATIDRNMLINATATYFTLRHKLELLNG
jgi:type IV secretory pathway TrbF-like protein